MDITTTERELEMAYQMVLDLISNNPVEALERLQQDGYDEYTNIEELGKEYLQSRGMPDSLLRFARLQRAGDQALTEISTYVILKDKSIIVINV